MTVNQLKAMCAKLFKIEVTEQTLMYVEEGVEGEFDFEEEYRQLSFYSIKDGGKIYVRNLVWLTGQLAYFWRSHEFATRKTYFSSNS